MKKLYYSISEVAELLGEEQYTIRYWGSKFDIISPIRGVDNRRRFTESDIKALRCVKQLLREERFTIEGAKRHIARNGVN